MMCRECGDLKTKVMRTTDYGVVVLRYRECDKCGRVFQTAEEEYGAVESIISVSRLKNAAAEKAKAIFAAAKNIQNNCGLVPCD